MTLEKKHNARKAKEFYGKATDGEFKDWNPRQEKAQVEYDSNTRKRMIFDGNHGDFLKSEQIEAAARPALDRYDTRKKEEIETKKPKRQANNAPSSIYGTLK